MVSILVGSARHCQREKGSQMTCARQQARRHSKVSPAAAVLLAARPLHELLSMLRLPLLQAEHGQAAGCAGERGTRAVTSGDNQR